MKQTKSFLSRLILSIGLCAVISMTQAGVLYKWVDDEGNVRYTDHPPTKKAHQTLNAQGVIIKSTAAPKTEEELAREKKAHDLAQEQLEKEKKLKQARATKDRVLLLTFSSEEELNLVRDNRIEVIESVLRLIDNSIATTQERLTLLENNAQTLYLSKELEVPGGLAQNIEHFTNKLNSRKKQRQLKQIEKDKLHLQYTEDLERYRFLKSR